MKFKITLHLLPVTEEGELGNLEVDIKEALEHIPCVDRAEVESEGRLETGEQQAVNRGPFQASAQNRGPRTPGGG